MMDQSHPSAALPADPALLRPWAETRADGRAFWVAPPRLRAPRVTVLVPAYNAASTLPQTLDSLLAQTVADVEILVIDDHSGDATWQVMADYARRSPQVRCLHMFQRGNKSIGMNTATDLALGRWIAICDADDWFAPDRLERLLDLGERTDAQMVADNQWLFDHHAAQVAGPAWPQTEGERQLDLDGLIAWSAPDKSFDVGMLKPVFRADFIRRHKVAYDETSLIYQDFLVLLDFFLAGGHAALSNRPGYYYRQPFGSLSRRWAQETRRRYNFREGEQLMQKRLQALDPVRHAPVVRMLRDRAQAFHRLEVLHTVRDHLREGPLHKAVATLAGNPSAWPTAAGLVLRKALRREARA